MDLMIRLPADVSASLQGHWGNVPRHALVAVAVEGYRTGALTESQVRRLHARAADGLNTAGALASG